MAPHRGQLLRDYLLRRRNGQQFMLSDFRGKLNLVLVFLPGELGEAWTTLLRELARKFAEVRENETRVVVVVKPEQQEAVGNFSGDLEICTDEQGKSLSEAGATTLPAIYITDKFREVFAVYGGDSGGPIPTAEDVLGWVRFVAMQCPECHPPEWPADAL